MGTAIRVRYFPDAENRAEFFDFEGIKAAAAFSGVSMGSIGCALQRGRPMRNGKAFESLGTCEINRAAVAVLFWPRGSEDKPPVEFPSIVAAAAALGTTKGVVSKYARSGGSCRRGTFALKDGQKNPPKPKAAPKDGHAAIEQARESIERARQKAEAARAAARERAEALERAKAAAPARADADTPARPSVYLSLNGRLMVTATAGTFKGVPCLIRRCRLATADDRIGKAQNKPKV